MGPLNGRPAWDNVAAPTDTANYISGSTSGSKGSKGTGYVGSQSLSSTTGKDYSDKMGNYVSPQTTQGVKGANVKAMASITPSGDDMGSDAAMWGGRGVGGY